MCNGCLLRKKSRDIDLQNINLYFLASIRSRAQERDEAGAGVALKRRAYIQQIVTRIQKSLYKTVNNHYIHMYVTIKCTV